MSRAISEELAPIDLSLLPDVGLELQTSWQRSNSGPAVAGEVTDALPFTITGPAHVCDFLDEEGASKTGHLAPPNKITIQGERARRAGIPKHAASYAFAYPLESLSGDLYERIVCAEGKSDPWLFFLLLGGFVYFDVHRKLICCNAFVLTPSEHALTLAGPFQPSAGALEHLRETKRLRKITLGPLVASGFEQIAWINPAEKPGGAPPIADAIEVVNNGCLVYEMSGAQMTLFTLVNKAVFDLESTETSNAATVLTLPSMAADEEYSTAAEKERTRSTRAAKWRAKSQATEEKRSLSRAKALVYKPSAAALNSLGGDDDGPTQINPANYAHLTVYQPSVLGTRDSRALLGGAIGNMKDQVDRNSARAYVSKQRPPQPAERKDKAPTAPPAQTTPPPVKAANASPPAARKAAVPDAPAEPSTSALPSTHAPAAPPAAAPALPAVSPLPRAQPLPPAVARAASDGAAQAGAPLATAGGLLEGFLTGINHAMHSPKHAPTEGSPEQQRLRADVQGLKAGLSQLSYDVRGVRPELRSELQALWEAEAVKLREQMVRLQVEVREVKAENKELHQRVAELERERQATRTTGRRFWLFGGGSHRREDDNQVI